MRIDIKAVLDDSILETRVGAPGDPNATVDWAYAPGI
jgi:hypothetical protein